jgi:GNAT superfamily N-acetyltransferase
MIGDDNMASEDTPTPDPGTAAPSVGQITVAGPGDLPELLPLMRAYCDFYEVHPSDGGLEGLSRALMDDPDREGLQLLAREESGGAVGFATLYWSWSTARAARMGIMNDLFVAESARGGGFADRLILACAEQCRRRGARALEWETALENTRAQAVYDRLGGVRERWLSYSLEISGE